MKSKHIGKTTLYNGSKIKVIELDNGWIGKPAKFWVRVLDNKNPNFNKGEEFTLSQSTIYKIFREAE